MKILHNHYGKRNTYIAGNYVCNGCRLFNINKLNTVCNHYKVPYVQKKRVIEAFKVNCKMKENWKLLSDHPDAKVRQLVAANSKCLWKLMADDNWSVRMIARDRMKIKMLISAVSGMAAIVFCMLIKLTVLMF